MGLRDQIQEQHVLFTPMDQRSGLRRVLYKHMPPVEFEPAIPAQERLQTHALDRTAPRKLVYIR